MKIKLFVYFATGLFIFSSSAIAGNSPDCNSAIIQNTPDSRYTDNGDGTISDLPTGLMWQKCSIGQSGTDCASGAALSITWDQALQRAENINTGAGYAGYNNWRLPNLNEIESLVNDACSSPSINIRHFPNTPMLSYWSSSPDIFSLSETWRVEFSFGQTFPEDRNQGGVIRLVRDTGQ